MLWLALTTASLAGPYDALLVGNSYTSRNRMGDQLEADLATVPAWTEASVTPTTSGGWTWADHLASAEGGAVVWTVPRDVVVLQEQSQTPGFEPSSAAWLASRDALLGLADLVPDAQLVLLMTWGRRDGDRSNPTLYPDFVTMNDRLEEGYLAYADALRAEGRAVAIAPVGRAFRAVWDAEEASGDPLAPGSLFAQLYEGDGSHPSRLGSILLEAVLYSTLSGRDPAELPAVAELDATTVAELRRVAAETVLGEPFGDLGVPWAYGLAEHDGPVTSAAARPVLAATAALALDALVVGGDDGGLPGAGEVRVGSGRLALGSGVVGPGGHLRLDPGATLALPAAERALEVTGSVALDGVLEVDGCPAGETLVVAAAAPGLPELEAPCEDAVLEARAEGLVLVVPGEATEPSPGTTDPTAVPEPGSAAEPEGCSCGVAALPSLHAVLRRR